MRFRNKLPADAASVVGIERGEHVLAWIQDDAGRYIVATESDLILQRRPPEYSRIGWETIDGVSYADKTMTITLVPTDVGQMPARLRIPAGDKPQLAVVVRDRVTSSIVVNEHVEFVDKRGLRVVARRRAGEPDLRWGYVVDEGVPVDDGLREQASALVEQIRLESGLA